jgi:DNA-binding FadR family transcriptional regulator
MAARVGQPSPVTGEGAVFRPLRTGNAFEETVERLLQAVRQGVVNPGERLPAERELAVRLGVSRVTLREAIGSLREAGYLTARRGRGGGTFVVARPPPRPAVVRSGSRGLAALDDMLALRLVLECGAAELAAARQLTPRQGAELRRLTMHVERCTPADYRPADSRLHLAIAELSGSPSLVGLVADARARINDLLDAIPLLPRNLDHSNAQHARVVAAVLTGQPVAARDAMREHLEGTGALLRGFLT